MRCAPPIPSRSSDVCSALSYKKEEAEEASINHNEGLPRTWHRRLVERVPRATPRRPDVFRAPTHSWRFGRTSTAHRPAMTRRHSPTLPNHTGADCARRGGGAGLRRHLVLQGRLGRPDGTCGAGRAGLHCRAQGLHVAVRLWQRHHRGLVGRVGEGERPADQEDDGAVDAPDGLPVARAQGRLGSGRTHHAGALAALVPGRRLDRCPQRGEGLDDPSLRAGLGRTGVGGGHDESPSGRAGA
mmetsp:Transcript_2106/g.6893  ORF Transcript_2106/g.6893 Transcript_2106/m.6893 type:complete len:242 (-) Transcript_2106:1000-1725(-)